MIKISESRHTDSETAIIFPKILKILAKSIDKSAVEGYIIDVVSTQGARVLKQKRRACGGTFRKKGKNTFCNY